MSGIVGPRLIPTPPSFADTKSFQFDGVTDYFEGSSTYSEMNGGTKLTLSVWLKPIAGSPLLEYVLSNPRNLTANEHQFALVLFEGRTIAFDVQSRTSQLVSGRIGAITYGAWNHILVCVDLNRTIGTEGIMFINGVDETTTSAMGTLSSFYAATDVLHIGIDANGGYNRYNGNIDELAIWSGQDLRDQIKVSEIYNGGLPNDLNNLPTAPQPTNWFRMGENATWDGSKFDMTDVNGGYVNTSVGITPSDPNPTSDVPLFDNKSFAYDGIADYVDIGDNNNLSFGDGSTDSPFSISTWVKMTDATKFRAVGKYGATGIEYLLATGVDDTITFNLYDNSAVARIGRKYNTALTSFEGQWLHLVATYNGNSSTSGLKVYLNGTRVDDTNSTTGSYTAMENTTQPLYLGKITTSYANGNINDTSLFNSELSQEQVTEIYNGGIANDISSLNPLSYWRSEFATWDGSNWTMIDQGSGANNGTSVSMPLTSRTSDVPI